MNTVIHNMSSKQAIIDLQFVTDNNHSFIKELAVYDYNIKLAKVYCFLPPYPEFYLNKKSKDQNAFAKKFIHDFDWNSGSQSFQNVENVLKKYKNHTIFVKGSFKKQLLENYNIENVIDVDADVPSLQNNNLRNIYCFAHKKVPNQNHRCALKNVYFIEKHISVISTDNMI